MIRVRLKIPCPASRRHFLLHQGRGLAIVEVKRPDTALLSDTPYRNQHVFAPSTHLSGAVTQTLTQLSALPARWFRRMLNNLSNGVSPKQRSALRSRASQSGRLRASKSLND